MVYTSDLERECAQRGIAVIKSECTSHKILPSLRFTESLFRHYMLPTLHIVQDLLMGFSPIIRLFLKLFMRKSGGFLHTLSEWYDANLSEGFFTQHMAYHRFYYVYLLIRIKAYEEVHSDHIILFCCSRTKY